MQDYNTVIIYVVINNIEIVIYGGLLWEGILSLNNFMYALLIQILYSMFYLAASIHEFPQKTNAGTI